MPPILTIFLSACFALSPTWGIESHDYNASDFPEAIDLGEGKYDFGGVIIDRYSSTLDFEALCNQTSGLVEYALVHRNGKVHESLFTTNIPPRWIHACFLLLRTKPFLGMFGNEAASHENTSMLRSPHEIRVLVHWESNGTRVVHPLASLVYNQISDRTLDANPFVFTGSRTIEGIYLAQRDGSILAVYHDPDAIINSLDPDSSSDDSWVAMTSMMPPLEHKVRISLQIIRKSK